VGSLFLHNVHHLTEAAAIPEEHAINPITKEQFIEKGYGSRHTGDTEAGFKVGP
jgi:hypothetical protein